MQQQRLSSWAAAAGGAGVGAGGMQGAAVGSRHTVLGTPVTAAQIGIGSRLSFVPHPWQAQQGHLAGLGAMYGKGGGGRGGGRR